MNTASNPVCAIVAGGLSTLPESMFQLAPKAFTSSAIGLLWMLERGDARLFDLLICATYEPSRLHFIGEWKAWLKSQS